MSRIGTRLARDCGYVSQLFGQPDPDMDVSPDTEDPEAAGNVCVLVYD